jgi:hypothetical protein
MRIYDGSPRQDFEEVLRSIGAYLDGRGTRDVMVMEAPDGFIVQGLTLLGTTSSTWSEAVGKVEKETMTFLDDDISRFMDAAAARRGGGPQIEPQGAGRYEHSFRVIGRYLDEQHPRDIFFFEQDGAFLLRLHYATQAGSRHTLVEFTRDDVEALIAKGPTLRTPAPKAGSPGGSRG